MTDDVLRIVGACAEAYGTSEEVMLGRCRTRDVSDARHMAMWLLHERTGMSYAEAARVFGRDHQIAMHACEKMEGLLSYDRSTKDKLLKIEEKLDGKEIHRD